MKKKGNKKPEEMPEEKKVDQKDMMAVINTYLKISEIENKIKEREKEKDNDEFQKLKSKNEDLIKEILILKEQENIGSIFDISVEIVS